MRHFALLAFVVAAVPSVAQLEIISSSGDVTVDGGPASPGLNGTFVTLTASGTTPFSSASMRGETDGNVYNSGRGIVTFSTRADSGAAEDLSFVVPAGDQGETMSAAPGYWGWYPIYSSFGVNLGLPQQTFSTSVSAANGATGSIDAVFQPIGYNLEWNVLTPGSVDLDNGPFDLNTAIGKVRLDKTANPDVTITTITGGDSVSRPALQIWNGTESVEIYNPHADRLFVGASFFLFQGGNYVTGVSHFGPILGQWNAGEAGSTVETSPYDASGTLKIGSLANGIYQLSGGTLIWNNFGYLNSFESETFPATGNFESTVNLEIEIVPAPAPILAMLVGLAGLTLRRRNVK